MRAVNRLLVLLFGLALAGGGVLVMIEAVWTWTGSGFVWIPGKEWLRSFESTAWSTPEVIAISVAVAVGGLLLVLAELSPQRDRTARFETDAGTWVLLRRSTEAHLSRRLETQVAVRPIKARIKPSAHRWRVEIRARAAASTQPALQDATRSELNRLRAPGAQLKVRATGTSKP